MLFNVYINSLMKALLESDLGCHLHTEYVWCLIYGDDILLLSASLGSLQKMLDVCYRKGRQLILFLMRGSRHFCGM